jgi:hypothetical protein
MLRAVRRARKRTGSRYIDGRSAGRKFGFAGQRRQVIVNA